VCDEELKVEVRVGNEIGQSFVRGMAFFDFISDLFISPWNVRYGKETCQSSIFFKCVLPEHIDFPFLVNFNFNFYLSVYNICIFKYEESF